MRVDLFDFELPEDRIALYPASPRDSAKLLLVGADGALSDRVVFELPDLLTPGDVLVVNDTRVIPAELAGSRRRGDHSARISFNLHKRVDAARWLAFARPAKRLKPGDRVVFGAGLGDDLTATVEAVEEGQASLLFDHSGPALDEAIKARGAMPLPPYIGTRRPLEARDETDYQTVYARHDGAVAAPTAGLHFTEALFERLAARGVGVETVTLHVGAGTFLPMKAEDTDDHRMHAEWGEVSAGTVRRIEAARARGGRVVAVGTTSLRLLESAARATGTLEPFSGETDIFITPGFRFKAVDALMTNFHLPRSTLFMLVSAFCGLKTMQRAYAHAIENGYRFYSYGDSSLLFRTDP